MSMLTLRNTLHHRFQSIVQHRGRWFHRFDPQLDRLEEFASNFGGSYLRRVDGALLAMAGGFCALLLLAFSV